MTGGASGSGERLLSDQLADRRRTDQEWPSCAAERLLRKRETPPEIISLAAPSGENPSDPRQFSCGTARE
jgi:hypothetical protein